MTVFSFTIIFPGDVDDIQTRFVGANTENEAWEKLEKHFEELAKQGFEKPIYTANPYVELENVII